jgi:sigma-E factor negative regulatory protein RseA
MKADLSALMDDALDESEVASALDGLAREPALREDWELYHLIGDSLRQGTEPWPELAPDFSARVMAALDDEPTVLAPRASQRAPRSSPLRLVLPLAASVIGVGAVAWVAHTLPLAGAGAVVALQMVPTQVTLASSAPGPVAGVGRSVQTVSFSEPVRVQPMAQMREYVVAHEGYSPWVAVQGAARYQGGMSEARQDGAQ